MFAKCYSPFFIRNMGSEISSCCGESIDRSTQEDTDSSSLKNNVHASDSDGLDGLELSKARELFYQGFEVELILQNQERLKCNVRLDRSNSFLLLRNERKARIIYMKDIKEILHTPDDLQRIEKDAGIEQHHVCAAIHLGVTGNCIPLFFDTPQEKSIFVRITNEARLSQQES